MRIVVIGAKGQLGTELLGSFDDGVKVIGLSHDDIEVTDHEAAADILRSHGPDVVINTSAFHNVDLCETEANSAFETNATAVFNLSRVCEEQGAKFVHFSTDFVFDGKQSTPYIENVTPNPLSVYGASKTAGENLVRIATSNHLLIRTAGLFGPTAIGNPNGNFIEKMFSLAESGRSLKVVSDQVTGPTYTPDLARAVASLIRKKASGTFHITNSGAVSWHEFARTIFESTGAKCDLSETDSETFGAPARRPRYSVLSNDKHQAVTGQTMRSWDQALKSYLELRTRVLNAA